MVCELLKALSFSWSFLWFVHFAEMFRCRLCCHWACSLFLSWESAKCGFVSSLGREWSGVWVNALGIRQENKRIQTHYLVVVLRHLERWIVWMRRSRSKLKGKIKCSVSEIEGALSFLRWHKLLSYVLGTALAMINYRADFVLLNCLPLQAESLLEMGSALW